jgi:peptide/nickel transport system permease protein
MSQTSEELGDKRTVRWEAPDRGHETMTSMVWRRFRRHPGAIAGSIVLSLILLAVILAPLSPYDPLRSDIENRLQPPSLEHPFGTDQLGRDLLTRCLYGGRVSLSVGFLVVIITLAVGVPVGAAAGFFGGWIDNVLMRMLSAIVREVELPFFQGNDVLTIALVIGVLSWMTVARLVRASFLTIKEMEFITAANCLGTGNLRIMLRHILPNAIGPIIVEATLEMGYAIMEEAGLSFLGFGIMPPTASWGNLLNSAWEHMVKYPWLAIFPGLMIFFTIISINYIGDGLRDAFDPHKVLQQVGEV